MSIGVYEETLDAAIEFRRRLEKLSEKVDLGIIRLYIATGQKVPEIPASVYEEAEEIFKLRSDALKDELVHVSAQAEEAGILDQVPEDVLDGTCLKIGFTKEEYEVMPGLEVYKFFIPYTKAELAKLATDEKRE